MYNPTTSLEILEVYNESPTTLFQEDFVHMSLTQLSTLHPRQINNKNKQNRTVTYV